MGTHFAEGRAGPTVIGEVACLGADLMVVGSHGQATAAGQFAGGTVVADALLRGVAIGLTSAGLIATIRPFTMKRRTSRR